MADGIDVMISVVFAGAKSPDVCSWILGEQGMELADEDNDNIRIHSAYQASRRAMLQGIKQMIHNPGVSLFMVTWQHEVAGVCANYSDARCNEDLLANRPGSGCNFT
ncbi:hypothetical protein NQZ68_013385 [Dissostichus eleginoides]|nr:hypothetical protein NQZ68_013385 [Dissostichus eleginoides]